VGHDFTPSISVAPAQSARGFFVAFLITAVALLIPAGMSLLFFLRSGENWTYRSLVSFQRSHDAIFAPGAAFDRFEYKLEMIRQEQPQLVALGSSRALGFQGRYFRVPFVNAGQAMRSLEETSQSLRTSLLLSISGGSTRRSRPPDNLTVVSHDWPSTETWHSFRWSTFGRGNSQFGSFQQ
jgi:hypothetical protein